jgi:hypothetical protein
MRVVAARFTEASQASAALDVLQRELDPPDLAIAPLAHPGEPSASDAVLAGRFPDELAPMVVELVERAGGEIVADIDESWTRMNSASGSLTQTAAGAAMGGSYRFD